MAITGKTAENIELYYVTLPNIGEGTYEVIMSKKEIQSEIQRYNNILKIEKCILAKGEEISVEEIKPNKYKGKAYTYQETKY